MGQAKQRGTFEQRRDESIRLQQERAEALRSQRKAVWDAMTPEEQDAVRAKEAKRQDCMRMLAQIFPNMGYYP